MDDPTKDTIPRSAVEYYLRKETVNTNPDAYESHERFIAYMNDPDISQFGHWMHSNGFNCALVSIAVDLDKIPSVTPSAQPEPCEYYALCRHGRDESKLRARLGICEYCNEDADGYVTPIEKNCHAFIRFGMNGWELDLKANGWHGSAKIRYCPMCGRDLLVK